MNIDFREDVQKLIEYRRFDQFTPIQQKAIPLILKGRDVVGISATGTGKSHAFILPILQKVDTASNTVQALIIAPTRELAIQLYKMTSEINMFNPDIRIKLIASGKDKERMIDSLSVQPHIVIGTVGWLKDLFVDESVLRLDNASTVVIDEADMTLEMGFIDDVDMILGKLNRRLQIAVFSATVPDQLQSFLRKYMYRPQIIEA
ncbi:MAG: DEAD/DEAH box helicase, partial [Erysipelotrichaceae bacterium]|nr:DEAD/DEAH box helicase [Erysipelotrichaceae bacterium]